MFIIKILTAKLYYKKDMKQENKFQNFMKIR